MTANLEVNIGVEDAFFFPNERRVTARWALAIDYLKDRVANTEEGDVFENDAVRLVISREGFYCEFVDSPTAFYGATRSVQIEHLRDDEVTAALWEAMTLYRAGHGRVMVIYGPDYNDNDEHIFVGHYDEGEPIERGDPKLEMPMFFRADIDEAVQNPLIDSGKGAAFMIRTRNGENLLLRVPNTTAVSAVMQGVRE
jgi:hypothetical protein